MSPTARQTRNVLLAVFGTVGMAIAVLLVVFWPSVVVMADPDRNGANSIPSESMAPTLMPGDYVTRVAIDPEAVTRGMVVVFAAADGYRVSRIAGLPGDTIELRGGIVYLNGQRVPQLPMGVGPPLADNRPSKMFGERFPGEVGSHRIIDLGLRFGDDFPATVVPPGRLFVLGDNRDNAADSRFTVKDAGVGMVEIGQLVGQVKAIYWSKDHGRIGTRIDR